MIIVQLFGGLGNQMFQFASARALAHHYNTELKIDTTLINDRANFFNKKRNFVFRNYALDVYALEAKRVEKNEIPLLRRKWGSGTISLLAYRGLSFFNKGREKSYHYNEHFFDLPNGTYMEGYWQHYRYFDSIKETIVKDFTLGYEPTNEWKSLRDEIKKEHSLVMFVRRADFLSNRSASVAMTGDFYKQAFTLVSKKKLIKKMFVFSDDLTWCRENIDYGIDTIFVGSSYAGTEFEGHMILMSYAPNIIIPNSTFSWWSAYLPNNENKTVVASKQWNKVGSAEELGIYPPEWIIL